MSSGPEYHVVAHAKEQDCDPSKHPRNPCEDPIYFAALTDRSMRMMYPRTLTTIPSDQQKTNTNYQLLD